MTVNEVTQMELDFTRKKLKYAEAVLSSLEGALRFYADSDTYKLLNTSSSAKITKDMGHKARETLMFAYNQERKYVQNPEEITIGDGCIKPRASGAY